MKVNIDHDKEEITVDGMEVGALLKALHADTSISPIKKITILNEILQSVTEETEAVANSLKLGTLPDLTDLPEHPEHVVPTEVNEDAAKALIKTAIPGVPLCIPLDDESTKPFCKVGGDWVGSEACTGGATVPPCQHYAGMVAGSKLWCNLLNNKGK